MDQLYKVGLSTARESIDRASSILSMALAGGEDAAPGATFVRVAIAQAVQKDGLIAEYAAARWGAASEVARILKTGVSGGSLQTQPELWDGPQGEFLEAARALSVIGRLPGIRYVAPNTPGTAVIDGAVGFWVAEGRAVPLKRTIFSRDVLRSLKVAALAVFSNELLASTNPRAEEAIRRDLLRAVALAMDLAFLDPNNAGVAGEIPAAVTYNPDSPQNIESSGDLADDIGAMLESFTGDLMTSAWVLHPTLAAKIGLLSGGRGAGADVGAIGGTMLKLPAIVSAASPVDQIALIDGGGILAVDEGAEVRTSSQALVELDGDPQGEAFSPSGATANLVSLYQNELTGLLVIRRTNWENRRAGGTVVLSNASYDIAS